MSDLFEDFDGSFQVLGFRLLGRPGYLDKSLIVSLPGLVIARRSVLRGSVTCTLYKLTPQATVLKYLTLGLQVQMLNL